jgi:dipeptide/tripeptide permease
MGINLGAFIAPLAATVLHEIFGTYNAAFMAAAIGMGFSLVVFEIWKSRYLHADNKHAAGQENQRKQEAEVISKTEERDRLIALGIIFSIIIFFWMAFHQNGLTFTLFAQRSTADKYVITEAEVSDWNEFRQAVLNDSIPLSDEIAALNPKEEMDQSYLDKLNAILRKPELFFIDGKRVQELPWENIPNEELRKDFMLGMEIKDNERIKLKKSANELDGYANIPISEIDQSTLRDIRIVNRELLSARYPQITESVPSLVRPATYLKPETYATFNPLFILILTPIIVALFSHLNKRGKEPSTPGKMGIGMFITAGAILILIVASVTGGNRDINNMGPQWLISMYFMITIGELFISPMGLSFVSKVAPARIRGMMMGFWFGATAVGNYLSGFIGGFYDSMSHSMLFGILFIISIIAGLAVFLFLPKLKRATGNA